MLCFAVFVPLWVMWGTWLRKQISQSIQGLLSQDFLGAGKIAGICGLSEPPAHISQPTLMQGFCGLTQGHPDLGDPCPLSWVERWSPAPLRWGKCFLAISSFCLLRSSRCLWGLPEAWWWLAERQAGTPLSEALSSLMSGEPGSPSPVDCFSESMMGKAQRGTLR